MGVGEGQGGQLGGFCSKIGKKLLGQVGSRAGVIRGQSRCTVKLRPKEFSGIGCGT